MLPRAIFNFLASSLENQATHYFMAKLSEDFLLTSRSYNPRHVPLANYYLKCLSVELGLKASIIAFSDPKKRKDLILELSYKNKGYGHNLKSLITRYEKDCDEAIFSKKDKQEIEKINIYYNKKDLEYFTLAIIKLSMNAYDKLPRIDTLDKVAEKVNKFLRRNKYFIGIS